MIKIAGKYYPVGTIVRATHRAHRAETCPEGLEPIIYKILYNERVALHCRSGKVRDYNWHDLQGELPSQTALWIEAEELEDQFLFPFKRVKVTKDIIMPDGFNLKGLEGTELVPGRQPDSVFVEFDRDVGGGSADGIGMTGRCLEVRTNNLKFKIEFITAKEIAKRLKDGQKKK